MTDMKYSFGCLPLILGLLTGCGLGMWVGQAKALDVGAAEGLGYGPNTSVLTLADGDGSAFLAALRAPCSCDTLLFDTQAARTINLTDIDVGSMSTNISAPRVVRILGSLEQPVVFDYAYRSEATFFMMMGTSQIVMDNVVFTGLCFRWVALIGRGIGWYSCPRMYLYSQQLVALPNAQLLRGHNIALVTTQAELYGYLYIIFVYSLPIDWGAYIFRVFWDPRLLTSTFIVHSMTAKTVTFSLLRTALSDIQNVTFTTDPQEIGQSFKTTASRMCAGPMGNGTVLLPEQYERNLTASPVWIVDSSQELGSALAEINRNLDKLIIPPGVILMRTISLPDAVAAAATTQGLPPGSPYPLPSEFTLMYFGRYGTAAVPSLSTIVSGNVTKAVCEAADDGTRIRHSATGIQPGHLDLGGTTNPLFTYAPNSSIMLSNLVISGLGSAALPHGSVQSALPLWAFDAMNNNTQLRLDNSTIVLPVSDYAALVAAALRGAGWKSGAKATAGLLSGVSALVPAPVSATYDPACPTQLYELRLSTYIGWGLNATNLRLVPVETLHTCDLLPDWGVLTASACAPPLSTSTNTDDTKSSNAVAIGVGVGVGGAVLLAAGMLLAVLVLRRRSDAPGASSKDVEALDEGFDTLKEINLKNEAGSTGISKQYQPSNNGTGTSTNGTTTQLPSSLLGHQPRMLQALHEMESGLSLRLIGARSQRGGSSSPSHTISSARSSNRPLDTAAREDELRQDVAAVAQAIVGVDINAVKLEGVLGAGASGRVYIGTWRGMQVAVKTVVFSTAGRHVDPSLPTPHELAVREAAMCAALNHPNVVSTYHYDIKRLAVTHDSQEQQLQVQEGSEEGSEWKMFLIQELCVGSLDVLVSKGVFHTPTGALYLDLTSWVLADVAAGLEYLHSKQVVHGDLKPANILLKGDTRSPAGARALVADFGLSRVLDPGATHLSNYRAGTPYYMAPEVIHLNKATVASDMYGFGVLCWSLLHKSTPYLAQPDGTFIQNPAFPHFPVTPEADGFVKLASRCLSVQPSTRPSAQQAREAMALIVKATTGMEHRTFTDVHTPAASSAGSQPMNMQQQQQVAAGMAADAHGSPGGSIVVLSNTGTSAT